MEFPSSAPGPTIPIRAGHVSTQPTFLWYMTAAPATIPLDNGHVCHHV